MEIATSLRVKHAHNTTTLNELVVQIFVKVPVYQNLKLCFYSRNIHFTLRNVMVWWVSPVNLFRCDIFYARLYHFRYRAFETFNSEQFLGYMQEWSDSDILQDNLVIIMDSISFLLVFESTKSLEMASFGTMCWKFNFVAGVVFISANLHTFQEAVRVYMENLDIVTIVNKFTLSHQEYLVVLQVFFLEFLLQLD